MSEVDDYLKQIEPSKRKALQRIRSIAKSIVPGAEETISYKMPTLKLHGESFFGYSVHENHIGIYPYSGSILPSLKAHLAGYRGTKSALHVPFDKPISKALLARIIAARLKHVKSKKR